MLLEPSGGRPVVLQLVEEPLDEGAIGIKAGTDGGTAHATRRRFDVGPAFFRNVIRELMNLP